MNRFEIHIRLCNEDLRLTFARVLCPAGEKYFVKAVGERTCVVFEMRKRGKRWHMAPPVPAWLLRYEAVLAGIVQEKDGGENGSPPTFVSSPQ